MKRYEARDKRFRCLSTVCYVHGCVSGGHGTGLTPITMHTGWVSPGQAHVPPRRPKSPAAFAESADPEPGDRGAPAVPAPSRGALPMMPGALDGGAEPPVGRRPYSSAQPGAGAPHGAHEAWHAAPPGYASPRGHNAPAAAAAARPQPHEYTSVGEGYTPSDVGASAALAGARPPICEETDEYGSSPRRAHRGQAHPWAFRPDHDSPGTAHARSDESAEWQDGARANAHHPYVKTEQGTQRSDYGPPEVMSAERAETMGWQSGAQARAHPAFAIAEPQPRRPGAPYANGYAQYAAPGAELRACANGIWCDQPDCPDWHPDGRAYYGAQPWAGKGGWPGGKSGWRGGIGGRRGRRGFFG